MTWPQLWALSLLKAVREFYSFIVASWLGSTAGLQHVYGGVWCCAGWERGTCAWQEGAEAHAETLKQSGQGPVAAHICFPVWHKLAKRRACSAKGNHRPLIVQLFWLGLIVISHYAVKRCKDGENRWGGSNVFVVLENEGDHIDCQNKQ